MLQLFTIVSQMTSEFCQGFYDTHGFDDFEERRRTKYNKKVATRVCLESGLKEGIARQVK